MQFQFYLFHQGTHKYGNFARSPKLSASRPDQLLNLIRSLLKRSYGVDAEAGISYTVVRIFSIRKHRAFYKINSMIKFSLFGNKALFRYILITLNDEFTPKDLQDEFQKSMVLLLEVNGTFLALLVWLTYLI